ncbi:matrixin family metalloprotease [Austwickia chelonae]|uniref:matrixin family metalloprotease n=1 Tax=Austwickia chelonae TaxID=100225 RepID=UPI001F078102|nr:M57 family metalloprotease [Austwickia chelonae]
MKEKIPLAPRIPKKTLALATASIAVSAICVVAPNITASASSPSATPASSMSERMSSFEKFEASTYRDTDGQWIVNGDEAIRTRTELRAFYDMLNGKSPAKSGQKLIVNQVYGEDDVWTSSQVGRLTYCVSTRFGSNHSRIVEAMRSGAAQWERASSAIGFEYVSSENGSCDTRNRNVVFSVEPASSSAPYIARAFFPSSPKYSRNVLVNTRSIFGGSSSASNVMAHELGHVLGLRHEHTRPESGTCFEDNSWRPLTKYDASSIMHYPQCNGTSRSLSMTSTDIAGIRELYGR